MIAKITGKIDFLKDSYAVVDVHGIGYKIFVTPFTQGKIAHAAAGQASEAEFYIHTYVREDTLALYGFLTLSELEMFELLISISGIGPKAAMGILSIAEPKTIRTAILNNDPSILTKVSGVGKKTAERVILELKNKISDMSEGQKKEALADNDAIEALTTMGYSVTEAREALKIVPPNVTDVGQRVKTALKSLGRK